MAWSADQYSVFLAQQTRPARDLLAAVPLRAPDRGSALPPYLGPLSPAEQTAFLAAYTEEITPHYPETGGRVLLAFPRSFFVAQAAS